MSAICYYTSALVVGLTQTPNFPEVGQGVQSPRGWTYEVRARIGGGHFGAVFDCLGPFDQPFALKVMMPANRPYAQVRREWLEEARRLWQLRHPNIVYVHDYFERDGLFYLVLERCDHSLEDMLGTRLTDRLVITLSRQLLFAMQYLIEHEIVHNDIHAGNILIVHGKEPTPKFSDFGIAQDLYGRAGVRPPIVNNRIMAPEVALGGYSTTQSDLYQLGLLMYGMYTGQPPLDLEAGYDDVIRQIRAGVPRSRAEALGTPLGSVISVLLRRHEQYRFNSPGQVWEELKKLDAWQRPVDWHALAAQAKLELSADPLSVRGVVSQPGASRSTPPRALRSGDTAPNMPAVRFGDVAESPQPTGAHPHQPGLGQATEPVSLAATGPVTPRAPEVAIAARQDIQVGPQSVSPHVGAPSAAALGAMEPVSERPAVSGPGQTWRPPEVELPDVPRDDGETGPLSLRGAALSRLPPLSPAPLSPAPLSRPAPLTPREPELPPRTPRELPAHQLEPSTDRLTTELPGAAATPRTHELDPRGYVDAQPAVPAGGPDTGPLTPRL